MSGFVEIPSPLLASIASGNERIPTLYFSANPAIHRVFWMRLHVLFELAKRYTPSRRSCLDFGGGGGVLLPSLAGLFEQVVLVDLVTWEAEQVAAHFELANVALVQADVGSVQLSQAPFDAIVAADVLEHFRDLAPAVKVLRGWLRDEGVLLTSLPTETLLYAALRRLFRKEKPKDHYHTAVEVERYLARNGFHRLRRVSVPLGPSFLSLYSVSAWRKIGAS